MASRALSDLHPKVMKMCMEFVARCKEHGIEILITSTYRSIAEQDQLYAQGRSTPGKRVTNARGGQSYHNFKCAFDFCPMKFGKCLWDDTKLFTRCGEIAEGCGLSWSGRWEGSMKELAHCQYTGGLTLEELRSGKKIA